ncbi:MAG: hypothetical protein KDI06_02715 [Calditrichaeota bacterium]|nr:hypothetical protein [Calditrichota bacterium]HQU73586.1 hypothetical protein [Calditrichia bacterium]
MKTFLLWTVSILLMFAAVVYQRTTGPTYPVRGDLTIGDTVHPFRLLRSQETTSPARVTLPPAAARDGEMPILHFRRYKTADSLTAIPFVRESEGLAAYLPVQPPAGKVAYFISLPPGVHPSRIPAVGEEDIVLRYKDPVPAALLIPHVLMMFLAILFGIRAGLSALAAPKGIKKFTLLALLGMTLGGMILGPFVQKFAFGEYWTGFPFGGDLTDNKTLIMWLAWVIAALFAVRARSLKTPLTRAVVVVAALVMLAVYLIPHSMRGSELNYQQVDSGVDPGAAIGTGD